MKIVIFLLLFLYPLLSVAQESFYKFQWFGSAGQAVPLGAFRADDGSTNFLETAIEMPFGQSYRIGFDFYPVKNIGITAGTAMMNFEFDKEVFEKIHVSDLDLGESYIINKYNSHRVTAGITGRLILGHFSAEPKITVGVITPIWIDAEFYKKTEDGEIYSTINYDYNSTEESDGFWGCLTGAVNINYNVIKMKGGPSLALFFFSEFTYFNPKIIEITTISDSHTDIISSIEKTYKQSFTYFYYGVGIIFKHGWFSAKTD